MAFKIGEISANVTADQSGFNASMNDVRKRGASVAKNVQQSFRDVGRRMQSIGMKMSAAITAPLVGVGGFALKTAADFESLRQSMDILNGSAEEGARNFERLKEFSAGTPFQLRGLAEAQNMLQGFGLSADDAFESVSMIGDIAAVSGGDIKGIGIAFGQAAAEGRLMTRDIRQLINQGVPAIKLLADTMGVAQSEVLDLASQGEISFEILQQAFQDATEEGGMFANGMAKQAKTLQGIFSTLKDNVSIAMNEIGQSIAETFDIKGLAEDLISQIQTGIDWFNTLSDETKKMAFTMAGVLGASGPIIAALGTLSVAIGAISAPIAGAAAAVGTAAALIISNWGEVESYFTTGGGANMWEDLQEIVDNTTEIVSDLWERFGDNIIGFTEGAFSVILQIVETALSAINDTIAVWSNLYAGEFEEAFARAESSWKDHMGNIGNIVQTGLLALRDIDVIGGFKLWELLGLIPSQEEINKRYADRMASAVERARKNATSRTEDVVIPADIDFGDTDFNVGSAMTFAEGIERRFISVQQASNNMRKAVTGNLAKMTASGAKFATITEAALQPFQASMTMLSMKAQQIAQKFEIEVSKMTAAQVNAFNIVTSVADTFVTSFGKGMQNIIVQGQNVVDVLSNIGKLLASSVIQKGLSILLSGGLAGGGFFGGGGGLLGNLFGSIFDANDALITSGGDVVKFHPQDNILAMRDFGDLGGGGGSGMSERSMERAFGRALDRRLQKLGPEEIFALAQQGQFSY